MPQATGDVCNVKIIQCCVSGSQFGHVFAPGLPNDRLLLLFFKPGTLNVKADCPPHSNPAAKVAWSYIHHLIPHKQSLEDPVHRLTRRRQGSSPAPPHGFARDRRTRPETRAAASPPPPGPAEPVQPGPAAPAPTTLTARRQRIRLM